MVSGWLRRAAVCSALEATGERLSGPITRLLVELYGRSRELCQALVGQQRAGPATGRRAATVDAPAVGIEHQDQVVRRQHEGRRFDLAESVKQGVCVLRGDCDLDVAMHV